MALLSLLIPGVGMGGSVVTVAVITSDTSRAVSIQVGEDPGVTIGVGQDPSLSIQVGEDPGLNIGV